MSTYFEDKPIVDKWKKHYSKDSGESRYTNELPRKNGKPDLSIRANGKPPVIAIVNYECDSCHTFLYGAQYPQYMPAPDGREIIYVDMHSPLGKKSEGEKYAAEIGYTGGGENVGSVVAEMPKVHGKRITLPDGKEVDRMTFPIFLDVDNQGRLTGTSPVAGVKDSIQLFGDPLGVLKQKAVPEKGDLKADKALIDRVIYAEIIDPTSPADAPRFSEEILKKFDGSPDSKEIEQEIADRRMAYHGKLNEGEVTRDALEAKAKGAPPADTAKARLEGIIMVNGLDCGCSVRPKKPISVDLAEAFQYTPPPVPDAATPLSKISLSPGN